VLHLRTRTLIVGSAGRVLVVAGLAVGAWPIAAPGVALLLAAAVRFGLGAS